MEKFGIFNFLNTFLGLNKEEKPAQDAAEQVKPTSTPTENLAGLGNLFKNLLEETSAPPAKDKSSAANSPSPAKPLNGALINAMRTHDEFIKRVKAKNPPQK